MDPTVQEGDKILITSPTLLKELIYYIRLKKPSKKNIVLAESGKSGKDRLKLSLIHISEPTRPY